jgi:tetratricopeptide (TPR) repeat protein
MPRNPGERYDFFLSRRGSVAAIAQEVTDVLIENGYKVLVQDYDISLGASFVEAMHEAIINSRDLIILLTEDYLRSPYTRKEFTSFEAERVKTAEERHIIVLRCEDVPLRGLLADNVYQTLVGVEDPEERKRRIIAAAERQSQAAPPPPRPFIGVPPRIASFTGRADELDRLDAILMQDKPAAVTQASVGRAAVQGMGGVGKTSLAVEYAHRFRGLYAGVCWCSAETRTGLLSALASLAVTLGATTAEERDVETAAKAALRRLAEQRATWLLVFDNVSAPGDIAELLPSAGTRVLITSRFSDWSELADEVALDVLPLEEAITLLEDRTGRTDTEGAKTLAEAVGCLPLALDHAAAYCKRTLMQFADYAKDASSLIDAAPRGAGYPRSVAATFNLAIRQAAAQCQAAEALMAYFAQCAPERIPAILIEGAIDKEAIRREALAALVELSLVKQDPFEDGAPAVTLHRLVHTIARKRAQADDKWRSAVKRVSDTLLRWYPADGYNNTRSWTLCARLTPHLLALRNAANGATSISAEERIVLLHRAGAYLHGRGYYAQAVMLLRDGLTLCENELRPEHVLTALSLNSLGVALKDLGNTSEARSLLQRALSAFERAYGEHDASLTACLNNLALLLQDEDEDAAAQALLERALAIRERVLSPQHPETVTILHNLGKLRMKQGDLIAARPLFERTLRVYEATLGSEHPWTATSLTSLASLLQAQGEAEAAGRLFERALEINEKVFGEHPTTALSLTNLARFRRDQGDLVRARLLLERALAVREKVLGPEHSETGVSFNALGTVLAGQGDYAGALPLYERALAILQKTHGAKHPISMTVVGNLSCALDELGRTEEGKALRERYGFDAQVLRSFHNART